MTNPNPNVLIVDDNEMNRDTLARRLRQQGFAIEMAANGVEALEMARKQSYDLVLLDIMMPEMDGYEVLQTMKADSNLRHIPVIMISALEEIESVMKCMELGAEDYLTKPFDPVLLKAAIARCLKKAPPRTPSPASTRTTTLQSTPTTLQPVPAVSAQAAQLQETMSLEEVAGRLISSGVLSRKGYMHLSKAIFNAIFNNRGLSDADCYQINRVFQQIQAGRIRIVD